MSQEEQVTYSYPMLPVMVQRLRERPYGENLDAFISSARDELGQQESSLRGRRPRSGISPSERRFLAQCHDQEDRFLLHAHQALLHLELFARTRNPVHLSECLLSYVVADGHFEQGLKLRKNTPLYSSLLVRGAA